MVVASLWRRSRNFRLLSIDLPSAVAVDLRGGERLMRLPPSRTRNKLLDLTRHQSRSLLFRCYSIESLKFDGCSWIPPQSRAVLASIAVFRRVRRFFIFLRDRLVMRTRCLRSRARARTKLSSRHCHNIIRHRRENQKSDRYLWFSHEFFPPSPFPLNP